MTLRLQGHIALPPHSSGGFDHGDVDPATGRVFVAHTANDTVEVIEGMQHVRTIPGCAEGSGVLSTTNNVFAASRGAGKVLALDSQACEVQYEIDVGPKPNGLAWDPGRRHLLVADVTDYQARLLDPMQNTTVASTRLPGRPRWCVFDAARDRFLVNIREPACVVALAAGTARALTTIDVSAGGPHGLDVDPSTERAFVACDAGSVVVLDLTCDREVTSIEIGGEPDAIWFNARRNLLYVAIGDPGLVDVLDCRRLALVQRLETEDGAHTTAFDAPRQLLYVFLPRSSRAAVCEVCD